MNRNLLLGWLSAGNEIQAKNELKFGIWGDATLGTILKNIQDQDGHN